MNHASNDSQTQWAQRSLPERLRILKRARHLLAARAQDLAAAISPDLSRTPQDTLIAEVLPLLAAAKFVEQQAAKILRVRRLGRKGLPFWLTGVDTQIWRVPFGKVLIVGPANYPLFLPGVQALQALTAGNSVVWKPGRDGRPVAEIFADAIQTAGIPRDLLRVTDESVEAVEQEIAIGVDKVFFTGSATSGRALLKRLAETLTPCVAELSGCDPVVVLPSAEIPRVVRALAFGLRLNGSATCMAPRRVLLVDATDAQRRELVDRLQSALKEIGPVALSDDTAQQLRALLQDARRAGAVVYGDGGAVVHGDAGAAMRPVLITEGTPSMRMAQEDIFAPVLTLIDVNGLSGLIAAQEACPFGLTAAVFGHEHEARAVAASLTVGTVLINDLIVPTADPRAPFGGRRKSGFGVTRGAEGLLEMTAIKTVAVRKNRRTRHYEAAGPQHEDLFRGIILATHAETLKERLRGVRDVIAAGRRLKGK